MPRGQQGPGQSRGCVSVSGDRRARPWGGVTNPGEGNASPTGKQNSSAPALSAGGRCPARPRRRPASATVLGTLDPLPCRCVVRVRLWFMGKPLAWGGRRPCSIHGSFLCGEACTHVAATCPERGVPSNKCPSGERAGACGQGAQSLPGTWPGLGPKVRHGHLALEASPHGPARSRDPDLPLMGWGVRFAQSSCVP